MKYCFIKLVLLLFLFSFSSFAHPELCDFLLTDQAVANLDAAPHVIAKSKRDVEFLKQHQERLRRNHLIRLQELAAQKIPEKSVKIGKLFFKYFFYPNYLAKYKSRVFLSTDGLYVVKVYPAKDKDLFLREVAYTKALIKLGYPVVKIIAADEKLRTIVKPFVLGDAAGVAPLRAYMFDEEKDEPTSRFTEKIGQTVVRFSSKMEKVHEMVLDDAGYRRFYKSRTKNQRRTAGIFDLDEDNLENFWMLPDEGSVRVIILDP